MSPSRKHWNAMAPSPPPIAESPALEGLPALTSSGRSRRGRAPVAARRWLITLALAGLSGGLYAMLLIGLLADPSCMGATF